jgi:hypothetical protein
VQYDYRLFDYEILIDFEYPFNRPRVFYQHENSAYGSCQDLLDTILEGGSWGPSMLISGILDKLPVLSVDRMQFRDYSSRKVRLLERPTT